MINITVRTWSHTKEKHETASKVETFLFGLELPIEVMERILSWAKEYQRDLLINKYKQPSRSFMECQKQSYLVALNKLWKEIQREGYSSKEQLHGVSFLFQHYEDNPELIDFSVTKEFLSELEQEPKAE
ncbi:MAG TPA: hypothetical protein V6D33_13495 [Cyanophyceae cyanobacterium]